MKAAKCGSGAMLVIAMVLATGCSLGRTASYVGDTEKQYYYAQELGPTLIESTPEHNYQISRVVEFDKRAFFNDLDLWFQTNRPSRLSRWVER